MSHFWINSMWAINGIFVWDKHFVLHEIFTSYPQYLRFTISNTCGKCNITIIICYYITMWLAPCPRVEKWLQLTWNEHGIHSMPFSILQREQFRMPILLHLYGKFLCKNEKRVYFQERICYNGIRKMDHFLFWGVFKNWKRLHARCTWVFDPDILHAEELQIICVIRKASDMDIMLCMINWLLMSSDWCCYIISLS